MVNNQLPKQHILDGYAAGINPLFSQQYTRRMNKAPNTWPYGNPWDNNIWPWKEPVEVQQCMHMACKLCDGTGQRKDGLGYCAHALSCPCPRCTPRC